MQNNVSDYEAEFTTLVETVRRDISKLRATFPDPSKPTPVDAKPVTNRPEQVTAITQACKRLEVTLEDLSKEAVDAPEASKPELAARIKGYKATLASLEKERDQVKKLSQDADTADLTRNAVSSSQKAINAAAGVGANDDEATRKAKQQLAHNTARMQDSQKILQEGEISIARTNEVADATLKALDDQNKKTGEIAGTTISMNHELMQVHHVLGKMKKELLKSKLMLAGVIAILVIAIIGLLYYKFGGTSGGNAAGTVSAPTVDDTNAPPPLGSTPAPFLIPTMPPSLSRR